MTSPETAKTYHAPTLELFGPIAALTCGGSSGPQEGTGGGQMTGGGNPLARRP